MISFVSPPISGSFVFGGHFLIFMLQIMSEVIIYIHNNCDVIFMNCSWVVSRRKTRNMHFSIYTIVQNHVASCCIGIGYFNKV